MRPLPKIAWIFATPLLLLVGCLSPEETGATASADSLLTSQHVNPDTSSQLGVGGGIEGLDLDCSAEHEPTGGSCLPTDLENACQSCVAARCCTEQEACNSIEPMNSCAFGSTLFEDRLIEGGEIACLMECLATRTSEGILAGDESDVEACSNQCAASECGSSQASSLSERLASCIIGNAQSGDPGCRAECDLLP